MSENRMGKQLGSRNEGKNHVQVHPAANTQDSANTPWLKKVVERSAHLDAYRENWAEGLLAKEKDARSQ